MKATLAEISPRFKVRENKQQGIQNYDTDNAYPQRILSALKSSGRAMQCTSIIARFIRGRGFSKPLYSAIVNPSGLTADRLLRAVSEDYAIYRGFAIHLNYNMLGEVVSLHHIPFKELRLGLEDEQTGIAKVVKHHPDWAKEFSKNFLKDKITEYHLFNPDLDTILSEAEMAGGFDNYKGQVYWYSANQMKYPEAWCDPVLEDVISDNEAKKFRLANITTNFMASHIMEVPEFEDEDEREEFMEVLKRFQGSENASKLFLLEKKGTEKTFSIEKVDVQDVDKLFEHTENSVLESIRRIYMVLPVLLGDLVAGKLATSSEISDAYDFTNSVLYDDRLIFEETFSKIFSLWHDKNINPSANYSIAPLQYLTKQTNADTAAN